MADIINGRYALADPNSGLTVFSLEGGELNMFGSCTKIRTSQRESYPDIDDAPVELKAENESNLLSTFVYGFIGAAVSACLAAVAISIVASATVLTGGAALAACAFMGASLGALLVTEGMVESDLRAGNSRSPMEFAIGLTGGVLIGFGAGATVYGVIAAAPALAVGVSTEATMFLGKTDFTEKVVPNIIKAGSGAIAAAEAVFSVNDAYACGSGYNPLLDVAFDNDIEAYETTEFCVDALALGYVQAAEAYATTYAVNEGIYIENRNKLPDYVDDQLDDISANVWSLGNDPRGKAIDKSKKIENNLGDNFPVCDTLYNRVLGSTKSYDTTCKTYSSTKGWYYALKRDIDKLDRFTEMSWPTSYVKRYMYDRKRLNVVIPNCELTAVQQEALRQAKEYAKSLKNTCKIGIRVYTTQ